MINDNMLSCAESNCIWPYYVLRDMDELENILKHYGTELIFITK